MEKLKFAPLYVKIREEIREKIRSGIYLPGTKIPTEEEFVKIYRVSRITVSNAIKDLVNEGLLERKKSRGTFVVKYNKNQRVAVIMTHTKGHLFEPLIKHLVSNVHSADYLCHIYDTSYIQKPEEREKILNLIEPNKIFIVDGFLEFPFEVFLKKEYGMLIFIYRCETDFRFPGAVKILTNFEYGAFIGVTHLLNLGHKRILLLTQKVPENKISYVHSFLRGCYKAVEEKGYNLENVITHLIHRENDPSDLIELLSSKNRPTAIFSSADFRVKEVFAATKKLKLKIPDDIAVVGFFNTPWCEIFEIPLTSISIGENKIGEKVKEVLLNPEIYYGKTIMIEPEIVIRESCGAKRR